MGGAALAGASAVGSILASGSKADAAENAAGAQMSAADAGIAEQRRQFDLIQNLLKPYVDAGTNSLGRQSDLLGINGNSAQQAAIDMLKSSPQFTSMLKQGENSILANASATGGLRGGNTEAALAQFSPSLLAQTINDQYSRLGAMSNLGQNSAVGVGNAGQSSGNAISALLQQQGAAQAGAYLKRGEANAAPYSALSGAAGIFGGLKGLF